ncbi:peptidylprolyl isomerase [Candidatus Sumerlaeota bacterium]|nr:peptidylprolyl isomerase [Candidatus Sumerlaeota bacterium]
MRDIALTLAAALLALSLGSPVPADEASPEASSGFSSVRGLYALFYTTEGSFACRLFEDRAYNNIRNFIDLACGYRTWTDPRTDEERREPYYDGLLIYSVTRNAMLVGGDPLANGLGSPGYHIDDEIHDDLRFDVPGRLGMANLGGQPNTNSGTWFVTAAPLPELDGRYTIIGEVVQGLNVVRRITRVAANRQGRPLEDIVVERIDIIRVLEGGEVVAYERSTSHPFAEVDAIPMAQRLTSGPTWRSGDSEFPLPELPPIYGPLPE